MQSPALATAVAALLAACPPSLIPQWIQDLNTVVGLIGFAITLVVWWQVRNVRLSFEIKGRLPRLITDIRASRKAIETILTQTPTPRQELQIESARVFALLDSAAELAPFRSRRLVRTATTKVDLAREQINGEEPLDLRVFNSALAALVAAETGLAQGIKKVAWK
jgi:hypothetical protein